MKLVVSVFPGAVLANVALNKRSYQVSTYVDQSGAHGASFANDGNVNSCARSQRENNPWWTVDLGDEQLIVQVNLINTGDGAGNHSAFIIFIIFICINYTNIEHYDHTDCVTRYEFIMSPSSDTAQNKTSQ